LRRTHVTEVDVLMAAVLHDTVEDTETTADELRDRFGARVTDIVLEVTDDKTLPKQQRKELQVEHAHHKSRFRTTGRLVAGAAEGVFRLGQEGRRWPTSGQRRTT
jgi:(p)ppGpp synthase/HD superfamily hydrolase